VDVSTLASEVVRWLAPFLPYLVKGAKMAGEEAVKQVGEEFTEDAWEQAKALWHKLRPAMEARPTAAEALDDLERHPDDEDARAALRLQVRKTLEADPALAHEVAEMLQRVRIAGRVEAEYIAPGGEATGAKIGAVRGTVDIGGEVQAKGIAGQATGVSIDRIE